jgi:hypothetical protein
MFRNQALQDGSSPQYFRYIILSLSLPPPLLQHLIQFIAHSSFSSSVINLPFLWDKIVALFRFTSFVFSFVCFVDDVALFCVVGFERGFHVYFIIADLCLFPLYKFHARRPHDVS